MILPCWTEVALQELFANGKILSKPKIINGQSWVEIDNYDDLALAEKTFSALDISQIDTYFIDLDGTVYLDGFEIPGSGSAINRLQAEKKYISCLIILQRANLTM